MRARWLAVLVAGCALTSKSAPLELRYFSPAAPAVHARADASAIPAPRERLRLGRVTPSSHLRNRIVRRASPVELDLSETLRWTEHPDAYVRRSLARALFEERGLERALGGPASTLEVEVIAFEAVQHADRHAGRIELRFLLHDERTVLASGDIAVERAARGGAIELVVAAIGEAMEAAIAELADRVVHRLCP